MRVTLLRSFVASCRDLDPEPRAAVFEALLGLEAALRNPKLHRGLGLRKLHPSGVWEVRIGLSLRALFTLESNEATFFLLGTHDHVKRFLRSL